MKTPLNFQFGMIFGFAISLTTICSLMLLDRWKAQKLDLYFGLGIGILFIILSLIFLYSQISSFAYWENLESNRENWKSYGKRRLDDLQI